MHLLCAPSKVLVVDYQNGHHLFNFLCGPPGIGPSHAGSGLASCCFSYWDLSKQDSEGRKSAYAGARCCPWHRETDL